eukprot:TCONS_00059495-protein
MRRKLVNILLVLLNVSSRVLSLKCYKCIHAGNCHNNMTVECSTKENACFTHYETREVYSSRDYRDHVELYVHQDCGNENEQFCSDAEMCGRRAISVGFVSCKVSWCKNDLCNTIDKDLFATKRQIYFGSSSTTTRSILWINFLAMQVYRFVFSDVIM